MICIDIFFYRSQSFIRRSCKILILTSGIYTGIKFYTVKLFQNRYKNLPFYKKFIDFRFLQFHSNINYVHHVYMV